MENALEPPGGSKYGDNPPQFLLDAMMEELGIGRINDLSLEDNPKDRRNVNTAVRASLAKPPTKEIKKITSKYGNEINMWKSFKPDDVDQGALLLDDLGSGQSHRLRMQASLAGYSNRAGGDSRGARGGHNGGSHTSGSSRGGGLTGQSNRRNRAPIEEIANLLRYSDPSSVLRGGRGGGGGGNNGRAGTTNGHFVHGLNNSPQAKNVSSGQTKQQTTTPQKTTQRRPPQQRPIQRNSSPLLSLATPESFFPSAKRVENTQPQPTIGQPTKRQPSTRQLPPKPPTTKQPASGQATARQPDIKPPATKSPVAKPPATGQPTTEPVAPISKPNKPLHINSTPKVPKSIAPDNTRVIPSKDNDEDLIFCDLISLDNDGWVSTATSTEVIVEEPPSGYMQDMWTLEDNANAVFNMIVEVTRKGMAKERADLVETIASGVVPDGRGMASSVYASDEPVTKESINTYWKTQGPSFRKGLENESIRLILEGAAAEIVRRDAPTSSDLGQQDVSGSVSEYDQSNPEEVFTQTEQIGSPGSVTGEPQGVSEPAENVSGSLETMGDSKKPEITFVQYDASELLQLRGRALTVDKSAFPGEIRQFVVKDTNDTNVLLQKPKVIKVLGGLVDSKWASPSETNDENVAPSTTKAAPIKTNTTPVKTNAATGKVNLDPSKANFVPSNTTRPSPMDSGASNFFSEKPLPTKATNGLASSKWADEPKAPDTYTPLDPVSAILSATVPVRPKRPGLSDYMWADNPPSKGSLTRPSINKEVIDRMINPQLTHSSREHRKKSIEIITVATKRRSAVLEKQAAEKEAALANYPHY
ncbi:hypothetical protein VC83_04014 [Pseudogymnoascus destructans]|uniref:Uncharacterized protein n=2 Tax=Pseudogymnoascus destructans TaxID=655981 RepID=L8FTW7_PSED2|nr:uncharacterized protein VC83_04014 [Pseudogymnoascus destructans]ELR04337.1 hypothetical protein, variant [Pseudogymnoascus destructans 20631-21]ELR04338.1 hypothetical protein GMDG_06719 [Pseudogymnoascus destructans 20631-21]OAF59549.1 hypothetical protein VC83_04014 [Pseudogymnoascus destructans]